MSSQFKVEKLIRSIGIFRIKAKSVYNLSKSLVEKYNGKVLARSANNITLDGREMVRVALAEFPDIETAKNCYNSEEYVEARKHLENNAIREHIICEGI